MYCYLTLRPIAIGHSGIVQCTSADIVRGEEGRGRGKFRGEVMLGGDDLNSYLYRLYLSLDEIHPTA